MARVSFVIGFVLIVHVFADVVVELDHGGLVRGSQVLSQSGKTYFSYTGIPYIEPPLNELRFKDPVPHNGWQGEFDATTQGPVCIQFDPIITSTYSGEEDCVVLNVYTPQNPEEAEKKLLPVMVWIHGGGFIVGTGQNELYNPSYLMDREIVLVSMNYRLNIFGFLSTEDSAASGNYGLKDQTEALKWYVFKETAKADLAPVLVGSDGIALAANRHVRSKLHQTELGENIASAADEHLGVVATRLKTDSRQLRGNHSAQRSGNDVHVAMEKLGSFQERSIGELIKDTALLVVTEQHSDIEFVPTASKASGHQEWVEERRMGSSWIGNRTNFKHEFDPYLIFDEKAEDKLDKKFIDAFGKFRVECATVCVCLEKELQNTFLENSRGELIGQGDMIIQTLKELMPFKVEYKMRKSHSWGSVPENFSDKPTGVHADIFAGDADVCPGSFSFEESKTNYFSLFHQDSGMILLLSAGPTSAPKNLRTIVSPFDLWTWIGIPLTMTVLSVLLRTISRLLSEPPEHPNVTIDFLRILLQQSIPSTPKHSVTRQIYTIWWLFIMVLAVAYTSTLTSRMTAPQSTKPIDTIQEIRNQPSLQFYYMDYGEKWPRIPYRVGKLFGFKDLLSERLQLVKTPQEAVNLVEAGKGIAIADISEYLFWADLRKVHFMTEGRLVVQTGIIYRRKFGGDPSKVTIFGESAGGGSVHSQVLSSQAKGLFHAAIPQSGSVFMPWAMEESSLEHAKELAGAVGCPTSSTDSLVECLRGKPADELIHQMPKLYLKRGLVPLGFGPRVDKEAENPFFKAEPIDLMRSGDYNKVPMLTGAVKDEGLLFVLDEWFDRSEEQFRKADQEWMNSICVLLIDIEATVPKDQQMRVCQEIRDMYLGDLQINRDNFWNYQKMLGDRHFYYGLRIMYEEHSRHAPTFVYSIEHEPQFGFTNLVTTMNPTYPSDAPQPKGVCHADDILILFKIGSEITPGHPDFEVKEQMLDIWTSFATNKRPPIEQWPTWSLSQPYHWVIDRNPRLDVDLISNHLKHFWDTLGINENQSKLAPGSSKDEL
ncbi:unnamed protein product [Cyprideis torosa]|uniref:Carboxylesterase n=1 Tax=Cyprideis torosa TaxID=163714 RepID=A0A7R8WBB6_9CRUS|nr:unnamed protein product [Cyprideis torosa]CAG0889381.1 unnamed protein product [Cyprideis torosa]